MRNILLLLLLLLTACGGGSNKSKESATVTNEMWQSDVIVPMKEALERLAVVYLDENLYCNRSLYSTIIKDSAFKVQYIVGILNSKAIQYYYQQKFKAETELFPKIRIKQARQLPIPVASLTEQQLIVALIERIRTSKKMTPNKSIEKLEREIDKIVYQLYELTDAEIKIIEQSI
ncbi:MAG: hypothetical protein IJ290_01365 [Bacteroidaceae bacterium]|nr:hypothetical protein [Bacteroidaceae bacterium]